MDPGLTVNAPLCTKPKGGPRYMQSAQRAISLTSQQWSSATFDDVEMKDEMSDSVKSYDSTLTATILLMRSAQSNSRRAPSRERQCRWLPDPVSD